jgi:hypothetical protein
MSLAARHSRDRHDLQCSQSQCREGAGACAIMPDAATP